MEGRVVEIGTCMWRRVRSRKVGSIGLTVEEFLMELSLGNQWPYGSWPSDGGEEPPDSGTIPDERTLTLLMW